jgi:Mg2+ and Co2+ transporter CorA
MTSNLTHDSNAYKAAEDRCIWLLNRADWKHEVRRLSTESELLEHQVVEKSNFNTLRRLVQCRKTTKRVKDSIKKFRSYTPTAAGDWTPIIQSWADQQQARSDQQRRRQADESLQQDEEVLGATSAPSLGDVRGARVSPDLHQSHTHFFPTLQTERNPVELLYWQNRMERLWDPEETADLTLDHVEDTLSRSLSLLQDAIAVQTSDRALWLALIATFYFPATLATGVFGMNLSLIDGKPYWWAIVVCAIMFVPNFGFLIYVFGRR